MAKAKYDRKLHEHMARLGAGLIVLKVRGAQFSDIVSYHDRVEFDFEREAYQITIKPNGDCRDDQCPIGATMVGWPHEKSIDGCIGKVA